MEAQGLIGSIRRDAARNLFRAKNGIKFATGFDRPQVGLTPKEAIWTREKATMWHYPSDRRTRSVPIVIVFSILGHSYILDLRPGASFVEWLIDAGLDVYLIDFGVPDAVDSTNTLETYVDRYLPPAIAAVRRESGSDKVDLMGYCFGGVLGMLLAAGHDDLGLNSLVMMASPVDFSRSEGVIQALQRGKLEIDDLVDETGNVPATTVHRMFRTLKPTSGISTYAMLWERLWSDEFVESFQAMSQWAADQIPFPGACARQCLDLLLRRNLLATGEVPLGGRTVRLADIDVPLLNIFAEFDHIVSPDSCRPLNDLVSSSETSTLPVPSGHVGLAASRQAVRTTIPGLTKWLKQHGN